MLIHFFRAIQAFIYRYIGVICQLILSSGCYYAFHDNFSELTDSNEFLLRKHQKVSIYADIPQKMLTSAVFPRDPGGQWDIFLIQTCKTSYPPSIILLAIIYRQNWRGAYRPPPPCRIRGSRTPCRIGLRKSLKKTNSDLGRDSCFTFLTILKELLWDPLSHCKQAIKIRVHFRLIPVLSYFFLTYLANIKPK